MIIKPVLDATGVMSVSAISFLSGCTVLAMSVVSVYKNVRAGQVKLRWKISTPLAIGGAAGGVLGKWMFHALEEMVGNDNLVGMVQAIVLILVTGGTLVYTVFKQRIRTKEYENLVLCVVIGLLLGIMSSFLGIGRGADQPRGACVLLLMSTKEAAANSLVHHPVFPR